MRSINSLTVGYIRKNWISNKEGEDLIEIGNPEFSDVIELSFGLSDVNLCILNSRDKFILDFKSQKNILLSKNLIKIKTYIENYFKFRLDDELFLLTFQLHLGERNWDEIKRKNFLLISFEGPEISSVKQCSLKNVIYFHTQSLEDEDSEDIVSGIRISRRQEIP